MTSILEDTNTVVDNDDSTGAGENETAIKKAVAKAKAVAEVVKTAEQLNILGQTEIKEEPQSEGSTKPVKTKKRSSSRIIK